ncbi:sigma-70 family RNA polymerase sigma factor [Candidatus Poribacteria bacterium]|nr:sigma-70 family RNA polymerase sigma factor [Candidatus Poribacteria bacterium]
MAEDAAQEAFLEVYHSLWKLREPGAFPFWFRKIVKKHCNRLTRRIRGETVPLEALEETEMPSDYP